MLNITMKIPQSNSVWGPSSFDTLTLALPDLYDLTKVLNKVFAEDSIIVIEGNNILTMQNGLNVEMVKLPSWLKANNLSLYIYIYIYTHYFFFKGRTIKDEITIKTDQGIFHYWESELLAIKLIFES